MFSTTHKHIELLSVETDSTEISKKKKKKILTLLILPPFFLVYKYLKDSLVIE